MDGSLKCDCIQMKGSKQYFSVLLVIMLCMLVLTVLRFWAMKSQNVIVSSDSVFPFIFFTVDFKDFFLKFLNPSPIGIE